MKIKPVDAVSLLAAGLLVCLGVFQLTGIGMQCNDDIRWQNECYDGGFSAAARAIWSESFSKHRCNIGYIFSYPLPFLFKSRLWFEIFKLLPIFLVWPLFGLVLYRSGCSVAIAFCSAVLGMTWQTNTFEYSPLSFFPGKDGWLLVWFLLGTFLYTSAINRYQSRGNWWPLLLLALVLMSIPVLS